MKHGVIRFFIILSFFSGISSGEAGWFGKGRQTSQDPEAQSCQAQLSVFDQRLAELDQRLRGVAPFGIQGSSEEGQDSYLSQVQRVLGESGIDFDHFGALEKQMQTDGKLGWWNRRRLKNLQGRLVEAPIYEDATNQELAARRVGLLRLREFLKGNPQGESKTGKGGSSAHQLDPSGSTGKKGEPQEQIQGTAGNESGQGESSADAGANPASGSQSQPQSPNQQEAQGSGQGETAGSGASSAESGSPSPESGQGETTSGASSSSLARDLAELLQKSTSSQSTGSAQRGQSKTPLKLSNAKHRSEFILRYLYLSALSRYHSSHELKAALLDFLNFLHVSRADFHPRYVQMYESLTLHQIDRLTSLPPDYADLGHYKLLINLALSSGNFSEIYNLAIKLLGVLKEINNYVELSEIESHLVSSLEELIEAIRAPGSREVEVTVHRFHFSLAGEISRSEMQERFGSALLDPDSKSMNEYYAAIKKGKLWSFRLMGLLRPFLNLRHRSIFTESPQFSFSGHPEAFAAGPEVELLTGDPDLIDQFVWDDFVSVEAMQENLRKGRQPYLERRSKGERPTITRQAVRNFSFLFADVSTSTDDEAAFRNLLIASFVDHHAEYLLGSVRSQASDFPGTVGDNSGDVEGMPGLEEEFEDPLVRHTIRYAEFNAVVGPVTEMNRREEAARFIKGLASNPEQNTGGGTHITAAVVKALEEILEAKGKGTEVQFATIAVITDGNFNESLDETQIAPLLEKIGPETEIRINFLLFREENENLRKFVQNFQRRTENAGPLDYQYRFIPLTKIQELLKASPLPPTVSSDEIARTVTLQDYRDSGTRIRLALEQVFRHLGLVSIHVKSDGVSREQLKSLQKAFDPLRTQTGRMTRAHAKATRKIVEAMDPVLASIQNSGLTLSLRLGFLDGVIDDLCREYEIERYYFIDTLSDIQYQPYRLRVNTWLEGTRRDES